MADIIEKNIRSVKKGQTAGNKFLVIQTAFIGDVVLATVIIEKLHRYFPEAGIDFLLRKGNEGIFTGHPYLHRVLIWDKKKNKHRNLLRLLGQIRKEKYDAVINVQRYASTGLLTAFSGAPRRIGFNRNPFSFFFTKSVKHVSGSLAHPKHETERNLDLVKSFTDFMPGQPRLYPTEEDFKAAAPYQSRPYITVSPASVWYTKQYPGEKWIDFLNRIPDHYTVYLLGGPGDHAFCEQIREGISSPDSYREGEEEEEGRQQQRKAGGGCVVQNLCRELSLLQAVALMKNASMNYVNDSAPLHFCSAVNAPVTAVFCSTSPVFGYGPLSGESNVIEVTEKLDCRPCGVHGYKACPQQHFKCALGIKTEQLLNTLPGKW